jgi:hypothetical protein
MPNAGATALGRGGYAVLDHDVVALEHETCPLLRELADLAGGSRAAWRL